MGEISRELETSKNQFACSTTGTSKESALKTAGISRTQAHRAEKVAIRAISTISAEVGLYCALRTIWGVALALRAYEAPRPTTGAVRGEWDTYEACL